jgi:hypothetical protein
MKKNYTSNVLSSKFMSLVCVTAFLSPVAGYCSADKFVDSGDYKAKDFKQCIISDYSDMVEGDDIKWEWAAADTKLADFKLNLRKVENKSEKEKKSVTDMVKSTFQKVLKDTKTGKGQPLNIDVCIYETQEFSPGKAWIPFVGGHEAQAGIGIEMVLSDKNSKAIAKFRHFAREGARVEDAANEAAEDLFTYISNH